MANLYSHEMTESIRTHSDTSAHPIHHISSFYCMLCEVILVFCWREVSLLTICQNTGFFWPLFYRIRTVLPYRENIGQTKHVFCHILSRVLVLHLAAIVLPKICWDRLQNSANLDSEPNYYSKKNCWYKKKVLQLSSVERWFKGGIKVCVN